MQNNGHLQLPQPGPDCASFADLLPLLGVSAFEDEETSRLQTHLASCAYCQAQRVIYDRLDVLLRHSFATPPTLLVSPEDILAMTSDKPLGKPSDEPYLELPAHAPTASPQAYSRGPTRRLVSGIFAVAAVLLILLDIAGILASRGVLSRGSVSQHPSAATPSSSVTPTASSAVTSPARMPPYLGGANDVLSAIQMRSSAEGWAVGDTYTANAQPLTGGTYSCLVLHYANGQWTPMVTPTNAKLGLTDAGLLSIAMISPDEGWAVGWGDHADSRIPSGVILHFHDGTWTKVSITPNAELYSVHMFSPTDGWVAGGGGWQSVGEGGATTSILWHYDGSSWTRVPVPNVGGITTLDMLSTNDGWATGTNTILHYNGEQWSISAHLQGIAGVSMDSATDGWAFGYVNFPYNHASSYNIVWHYNGSQWIAGSLPNAVNADAMILALAMDSASDGWAVGFGNGEKYGNRSTLYLHYTNGQWTLVQGPGGDNLNGVFLLSAQDGWAVGNGGVLMHYQNGTWSVYNP